MTALEAIEQSIREDRIVTLTAASEQDIYQLTVDCDDHVTNGPVHEFWGESTDDDGPQGTWRVHVLATPSEFHSRARYYTANDITPNRCTILDSFATHAAAEAAIETDDDAGVFELRDGSDAIEPGARAYHLDGTVWL